MDTEIFLKEVKFDSNGLVPVIAQDFRTHSVLMLAYANAETLQESLEKGKMVYWSRSRRKRWMKGEESGNFQIIKGISVDCDGDTVLAEVEQIGEAACHTGYESCFYRKWENNKFEINCKKIFDPQERYGKS